MMFETVMDRWISFSQKSIKWNPSQWNGLGIACKCILSIEYQKLALSIWSDLFMKCQISFIAKWKKSYIESHFSISPYWNPVIMLALLKHYKWNPGLVESGGIHWTKQKVFLNVLGMFQYSYFQQAGFATFHIVPVGFDQELISCFTTKTLSGPHARAFWYLIWNLWVFCLSQRTSQSWGENYTEGDVLLLVQHRMFPCRRTVRQLSEWDNFSKSHQTVESLCQKVAIKAKTLYKQPWGWWWWWYGEQNNDCALS